MALYTPSLAGWARVEITPDIPCPMGGYADRSGPAAAIHDPLYAYALALGEPERPLVVIICDLIGVEEAMVREARQRVARQFSGANAWLGATHTHSGPDVARSLSFAREQPDPALRERIIAGACDSAARAIASIHPVWVKQASGVINGVATNRDHPERDADLTLDILCFGERRADRSDDHRRNDWQPSRTRHYAAHFPFSEYSRWYRAGQKAARTVW